jgi:hypothetical protein
MALFLKIYPLNSLMAKIFNPNCIKICFESLFTDKFQEFNVIFFDLI